MPHRWTPEDDIIAFYLYRYPSSSLRMTTESISQILGMSDASLIMRIGNFQAIDGHGGLQNYARLSKNIYDKFRNVSQEKHLELVKLILKSKQVKTNPSDSETQ